MHMSWTLSLSFAITVLALPPNSILTSNSFSDAHVMNSVSLFRYHSSSPASKLVLKTRRPLSRPMSIRARVSVCVCVCERERERESECVCVCVCVCARARILFWLCVCACSCVRVLPCFVWKCVLFACLYTIDLYWYFHIACRCFFKL